MLQRLDRALKKYETRIIFLVMVLSSVMFFGSWHNLDLLQNYSMIYQQINLEYFCTNDALDVRDITDCTASGSCPYFKDIYIKSKYFNLICFILILLLLIIQLSRGEKCNEYR